jgi:hypothetical protein
MVQQNDSKLSCRLQCDLCTSDAQYDMFTALVGYDSRQTIAWMNNSLINANEVKTPQRDCDAQVN